LKRKEENELLNLFYI